VQISCPNNDSQGCHKICCNFGRQLYQEPKRVGAECVNCIGTSLFQFWTDEFLSWDPGEYDGLDKVVLTDKEIWLPDTILVDRYM
jgi:hypothetical protein